jgi:hypothetical protein
MGRQVSHYCWHRGLPELLHEFQTTRIVARQIDQESEYLRESNIRTIDPGYEAALIAAMKRIVSPIRDRALLIALQDMLGGKRNSYNLGAICSALAQSNCQAAVPLIEQATNTSDGRTRSAAMVALNALGKPPVTPEPELHIKVKRALHKAFEKPKAKQAIALLAAILVQWDSYLPEMQFSVEDVRVSDMIVFTGLFGRKLHNWGWMLEVPVLHEDRAFVRFSYICGRLCGEGFLVKLRKLNDRWLVTNWETQFIS